jgi:hypothetical protein
MELKRVVVTGLGTVNPLALNVASFIFPISRTAVFLFPGFRHVYQFLQNYLSQFGFPYGYFSHGITSSLYVDPDADIPHQGVRYVLIKALGFLIGCRQSY